MCQLCRRRLRANHQSRVASLAATSTAMLLITVCCQQPARTAPPELQGADRDHVFANGTGHLDTPSSEQLRQLGILFREFPQLGSQRQPAFEMGKRLIAPAFGGVETSEHIFLYAAPPILWERL
jgi:hypothetical protein